MFVFEWNGVTLKTNQRLMRNQWLIASLVFYFKERWHVISQTTLNWSHIFVRFQNINVPKTKIYHEKWNFTIILMFASKNRLWLSCAHILWLNILNSKLSSFTFTWWLISKSRALYNIMIFPLFPRKESSEVWESLRNYKNVSLKCVCMRCGQWSLSRSRGMNIFSTNRKTVCRLDLFLRWFGAISRSRAVTPLSCVKRAAWSSN